MVWREWMLLKWMINGRLQQSFGDLLPIKIIYQGKTPRCHPKFEFPPGWDITLSETLVKRGDHDPNLWELHTWWHPSVGDHGQFQGPNHLYCERTFGIQQHPCVSASTQHNRSISAHDIHTAWSSTCACLPDQQFATPMKVKTMKYHIAGNFHMVLIFAYFKCTFCMQK